MGIMERFVDVLKSYLNPEDVGKSNPKKEGFIDPDQAEAYNELNDFLGGGSSKERDNFDERIRTKNRRNESPPFSSPEEIPKAVKQDFAELGLAPGASSEECKRAYKHLLKIHHPDRHAGHPENMRKATEKSARINAAFDRIEQWRQSKNRG
ncbi:MAG: J domain-containing protein [Spirochaetaceae bacterium]|jgi:DnaJ-domain-containing protein 1|nr:J domain-containing protein [Spirochaetaceae bacterium]